jgi:hypothetical protein
MSDTTQIIAEHPILCPLCGYYSAPDAAYCARCGEPLPPPLPAVTRQLFRSPLTLPIDRPGQDYLALDASVILQFLPSGSVMPLTLEKPVILGRAAAESDDQVERIDLSGFNAVAHGVSRQHCEFRRQGTHLLVIDLNSTNGTYLNDHHLEPGKEAVVLHGDKLILGTLHLLVTFSTIDL